MTVFQLATALPENDDADNATALDFLASPPAPPPVRRRNRPPQPGTPGSAPPSAPAAPSADDEDARKTARLLRVLEMWADRYSQAEIAAHFRIDVRTVRRLLKEGQARRLATSNAKTAQAIVAEFDAKFSREYAECSAIVRAATDSGDIRLRMDAQKMRSRCVSDHVLALSRLGVMGHSFDPAVRPSMAVPNDTVERGRRELDALLMASINTIAGDEDAAAKRGLVASTGENDPLY